MYCMVAGRHVGCGLSSILATPDHAYMVPDRGPGVKACHPSLQLRQLLIRRSLAAGNNVARSRRGREVQREGRRLGNDVDNLRKLAVVVTDPVVLRSRHGRLGPLEETDHVVALGDFRNADAQA